MILAIDIGNSLVKAAVFEVNTIKDSFVFKQSLIENSLNNILNSHPAITHLIISSVSNVNKNDFYFLKNDLIVHFISRNDAFPFINNYESQDTLGIDRMVLAAGAVLLYPNKNRLIIDAGTCITYDFVDNANRYLGGAISPGIRLRYQSLPNYTAKLPLLETQKPTNLIGNSTSESIHSGVVNGVVAEIDSYIDQLELDYSNFIIILTGGDAVFLAAQLKNKIFASSNFLLDSLNQFLHYKLKNDQ